MHTIPKNRPGPGSDQTDIQTRLEACEAASNECLERALATHLDPGAGSFFWLERQARLGFSLVDEIKSVRDLPRLEAFDRSELQTRPLSDFVPRSHWSERRSLVLAESGGTSGRPTRCVFTTSEFQQAFGDPFLAVSRKRLFPTRLGWLFVGPSGPHVIASAAKLLARLHDSMEPFSVDLDPRWARAQEPGSLGDRLYRQQILDQALDLIEREAPGVLFTTPPLALELGRLLHGRQTEAVRGVHLGGLAVSAEAYQGIRELFPQAVVLPGYGNSMFGLAMGGSDPEATQLDYFPLPGRLHVQVVCEASGQPNLERPLGPGETGRVVLSRLDSSFFLPNLVERDRATVVAAGPCELRAGLSPLGVRDPHPVTERESKRGLY